MWENGNTLMILVAFSEEVARRNWTCSAPGFIFGHKTQGLNHGGRFRSLTELMPP